MHLLLLLGHQHCAVVYLLTWVAKHTQEPCATMLQQLHNKERCLLAVSACGKAAAFKGNCGFETLPACNPFLACSWITKCWNQQLLVLQDVAVSSGSACTSASLEPSYVLRALGVGDEMAHSSLRFGIGRFTTAEEVDRAVALTVQHVQKLREMSPLWEMVQEGIDINSIQWSSH